MVDAKGEKYLILSGFNYNFVTSLLKSFHTQSILVSVFNFTMINLHGYDIFSFFQKLSVKHDY